MHANNSGYSSRAAELSDDALRRLHIGRVAICATMSRQPVAKRETDRRSAGRYSCDMAGGNIHEWVGEALAFRGLSQSELARQLTDILRRSIDKAAVNKMISGKRDVSVDEMVAISDCTGFPMLLGEQKVSRIPIVSWVSAGRLADANTQIPDRDCPRITISDLGPGEFFALKVISDSMDRISPEGSIIVVNRQERDLVAGKPYVFSLRGETTYKLWDRDELSAQAFLMPHSSNGRHFPTPADGNVDLELVGRVRRTVLNL